MFDLLLNLLLILDNERFSLASHIVEGFMSKIPDVIIVYHARSAQEILIFRSASSAPYLHLRVHACADLCEAWPEIAMKALILFFLVPSQRASKSRYSARYAAT